MAECVGGLSVCRYNIWDVNAELDNSKSGQFSEDWFHMRGILVKAASYMENIDIGVIMAHSLFTLTNFRSLGSD